MFLRSRGFQLAIACLALATIGGLARPSRGWNPGASGASLPASRSQAQPDAARPDFARMVREQAETDRAWQLASEGYMRMEKITYRSSRGDLEIPAFVFQSAVDARRRGGIRRSCGCTRTFAVISTSTTSRSFATPSREATS